MAKRWFQRVVWIGIAANFALAVPALVAPGMHIEQAGQPPAAPLMCTQISGLLLIQLSIFYSQAGNDCDR